MRKLHDVVVLLQKPRPKGIDSADDNSPHAVGQTEVQSVSEAIFRWHTTLGMDYKPACDLRSEADFADESDVVPVGSGAGFLWEVLMQMKSMSFRSRVRSRLFDFPRVFPIDGSCRPLLWSVQTKTLAITVDADINSEC